MADLGFHHLSEDQLGAYIDVVARSRAGLPYEHRHTVEEVRVQTLQDPDFDPESTWLAYLDGEAVAFTGVLVEKNRIAAGMNDSYLDLEVVPEYRGKGIEADLMAMAVDHIRSKGIGKTRTRSMVADSWRRSLLEQCSFEEEYRVYLLARRGRAPLQPVQVPEGYRLVRRPFTECSDGDIASIVQLFNDSFRDHFNFAPEPKERWMNYRDSDRDPVVITLAMKDEQAVGICVSTESKALNEERGVKTGWIEILGVMPSHRRQGLGRVLLVDGMQWILDRGMDVVHIGVFAKNEKALDLYLSFGFEKDQESVWYCRKVA